MADTELWSSTIVSAALSKSCVVKALEACNATVLHGVMMSCGDVWTQLAKAHNRMLGVRAIIQSLLPGGKVRVRGVYATVDGSGKTVLARRNV